MKFKILKEHSLTGSPKLYNKVTSTWEDVSTITPTYLVIGPANSTLEVLSSFVVPVSVKHSLPSSVMSFWGSTFSDEILYINGTNYYDTISFSALILLESQGILEEIDESTNSSSCGTVNVCSSKCSDCSSKKEEDSTKKVSSKYNTTCAICGSPAYQGLGPKECSNGCN